MHTYLLSDEAVVGYLHDFMQRLVSMGDKIPTTWCSIGISGDKLMDPLLATAPSDLLSRIDVRRLRFDRTNGTMSEADSPTKMRRFPRRVLLIDGPIHSGASMKRVAELLRQQGASEIITYGLVVKRTTQFVPTFFGVMIGEHDRVYFQLKKIPNQHLQTKPPFGIIRLISQEDATAVRQTLKTGTSLDGVSLADLWYEHQTRGDYSYVFELNGQVAGFIHFFSDRQDRVFIDAIANSTRYRGQGIGGILMRWVENWARNNQCRAIELLAIEEQITFYRHFGFELLPNSQIVLSTTKKGKYETYHRMSRRLLYNIDPNLPSHQSRAHHPSQS